MVSGCSCRSSDLLFRPCRVPPLIFVDQPTDLDVARGPCLGRQAYFTFLSDHEPSWTGGTILRQREYHKEAEQWDKVPSSRSRNSRPGAVHPVSLSGCLRICVLFSRIEVSSV